MLMDNVAKQQLIEQLKPVVNEPEFESIFAAMTKELSGPERFKMKAELRRLARPCRKVIDLRKRVDGHCRPYKHKGFIHYMDDVAISIFESGLDRYRGTYTEDTYEQVHNAENNFRIIARHERERALAAAQRGALNESTDEPASSAEQAAEKTQSPSLDTDYFTFGRYIHRKEERMNFSVPVMLRTGQGDDLEAVTTNISVNGMRVKLQPGLEWAEGVELGVRFTGLAQEFTFDPDFVVPYRVVGIDQEKDFIYLRLLRDADFESETFDQFLVRFINGYKRRYKINIDNTYSALISKGHEQFYIPRMSGLPVYFRREGTRMFGAMALRNENNKYILDDWLNEDNQNLLPCVFTGKRLSRFLQRLKEYPNGVAECVMYTFQVLRQGKVYFYAATSDELAADTDLQRIYLAYASRTSSFRVYKVQFARLDVGKAWRPVTLPQEILDRERYLQRPPAVDVMMQLNGLSHIALINDITPQAEHYHHYECARDELRILKPQLVSRKLPWVLNQVNYNFVNFRAENRFGYRTRVRVRVSGQEKSWLGTTRDISTMGMQIDLEETIPLKTGDIAEIELIQLNRRTKEHDLNHLRYEVMAISNDQLTLHMRADVKQEKHAGRDYISDMLKVNQDEVLATRQSGTLHGLQLCLRNLYSASMMGLAFFLHRQKGAELRINMLGVSPLLNNLKELVKGLSNDKGKASVRAFIDEQSFQKEIKESWKHLDEHSSPKPVEVYVFLRRSRHKIHTEHRFRRRFASPAEEQAFIRLALEHGILLTLRLEVSRTGKPDIAFITNEFKYVNQYAAHKAKQLEQDLWSVVGLVDVIDCTSEMHQRLQLSQDIRQQQLQRLEDFLIRLFSDPVIAPPLRDSFNL